MWKLLTLEKDFFSAKNIAVFGVLLALSIVLQLFGGSITIGVASLNFSLIPLVLAALMFGPWGGAFIGAVNGVIVFLTACVFGTGIFAYLFIINPFLMFLICFFKTTSAGFVSGLLFGLLQDKNKYVAVFLASGIAPFVNTLLFAIGMFCMADGITEFMGGGISVASVIIFGMIGLNFFIELAINLLLAPALHTVYNEVDKRFFKL